MDEPPDLLAYERPLIGRGEVVVGLDEVGRGALAGPVTVGAVVVVDDSPPPVGLRDSKCLTPLQRARLVGPLERWAADWSLGSASADEIDEWGLRTALTVAATRALDGLSRRPTFALLDGPVNFLDAPSDVRLAESIPPMLRYSSLAHRAIVRGDQVSAAIAGAAVLAKVHRDALMGSLEGAFDYGWAANKGYGVPEHLDALRRVGPCAQHRRTWRLPAADGVPLV